ncbi:MAG: hypothetical protein CMJ77_01925 [Planctomycetaceae bacterium]|nr:hypothetical protein [Planctomycetaceae bacterium]
MASKIHRRNFLKVAGSSAATFTILQAGSARTYAANDKLDIACIGVGGRGALNLRDSGSQNIVTLCDVDWLRAAEGFKKYPNAKRYKDYRVMLAEMEPKFDAVIVSTPDHHHFHASMAAIALGKHVYCEKPLTHSVWEARELTKAAREAGVVTQMGNQAVADKDTQLVQEFVMDNAIGPIREAHVWTDRPSRGLFREYWPQGVARPTEMPAIPDTMDWDLWIGPAPMRPYHPIYAPFKWRGRWDFGTGALGDMGCHYFDPVVRSLKLGPPTSVEGVSTRVNDESYPLGSVVTFEFPARGDAPPVKVQWYDGGLRPPRPAVVKDGDIMGANGVMLVGDEGVVFTDWDETWKMFPADRAKAYGKPPKVLPRSPGHHEEWFRACKGGPNTNSSFEWAGPLTETVLLGNVALRSQLRDDLTQKKLLWDADKMAFTNHEAANQFLRREYREGWEM